VALCLGPGGGDSELALAAAAYLATVWAEKAVAQRVGFGLGPVAVHSELPLPGGQGGGGQRSDQPGVVLSQPTGRELADPGVLPGADPSAGDKSDIPGIGRIPRKVGMPRSTGRCSRKTPIV
jgi:hypothetical protein